LPWWTVPFRERGLLVCGLDDLRAMKAAVGCEQDPQALDELDAIGRWRLERAMAI
jgi:hypothetical protein